MSQLPIFIQIFILVFWMVAMPWFAGGNFANRRVYEDGQRQSVLWIWVCGQFVLWGMFQLLCVPFILAGKDFKYVVAVYLAAGICLAISGAIRLRSSVKNGAKFDFAKWKEEQKGFQVFWVIFGALMLLQLVQVVRLAYGDGDDAYYVAVSTITENAETMYQKLPYTGGSTMVDIRHGLAPFPIWIAFLAQISGVRTVSVAHIFVPLVLIPMTYMIFYLFAGKLFAGKEGRISLFLIFTQLLVLFGDYSFYTVENFMLARSRQGKAALGSIVIPMIFLLLYLCMLRLQEERKCGILYWILLVSVMLSGCLCSTMGAFLLCILLGITGLCAAVCYRNWRVLIPLAVSCLPCVVFAIIYVLN